MLQLNPPIPLETPLGFGLAMLHDSVHDQNDQWTVFLDSGFIWTFDNSDVRVCENLTVGRKKPKLQRPEGWETNPVGAMRKYFAEKERLKANEDFD